MRALRRIFKKIALRFRVARPSEEDTRGRITFRGNIISVNGKKLDANEFGVHSKGGKSPTIFEIAKRH